MILLVPHLHFLLILKVVLPVLIMSVGDAALTVFVVNINAQIHAHCSDSVTLVQLLLHNLLAHLVLGRCSEHRFARGHGGRRDKYHVLIRLKAHTAAASAAGAVRSTPCEWWWWWWRWRSRWRREISLARFSLHDWRSSIEDEWIPLILLLIALLRNDATLYCHAVHKAQRTAIH